MNPAVLRRLRPHRFLHKIPEHPLRSSSRPGPVTPNNPPAGGLKNRAGYDIRKLPMKRFLLIALTFCAFIPCALGQSQLLDQVVAVVNDEVITQSELDTFLRPLYEQYKNEYQGEKLAAFLNEVRQKLLNQLIEDRLVFQEAGKQKIEIDETEIDTQMEDFKKRFPNETALEDALKKEGMTLTRMRDRLRRQAMIRRLQDMEVRSKIVVSPLEVESYFTGHPEEFSRQDRLKVRSITIKKSDEAREKGLMDEPAKNKILELRRKVLSGDDFGALARQNSEDAQAKEGGLSDWVEQGAMIPAIDDAIFKIKPGEVSEIIETPMGYHIFRLEEKQAGKKRTLEEAREEIVGKLFREKAAERFRQWTEELKRNAYISIR